MNLKIYELRGNWYSQTYAGTVIAESEEEARRLMAEYVEDFYAEDWLDPTKSTCEEVTFEKGVIMTEWVDR